VINMGKYFIGEIISFDILSPALSVVTFIDSLFRYKRFKGGYFRDYECD
jgi:hypothetical protein